MAKVSIVIPCYNAGDQLIEAVESALAQSYQDLEVVIVDDGSSDERTLTILDHARWPRTTIIRQSNAGPAAARNRAVAAATGEFILPLDADDRIDPTYVEKAVAVLQSSPHVGVVYCRAMKFGAESGPWALPAYTLRELVIDNVIFVTALYRKGDWLSVGGYSETLRHGVEDYEFWVKIVALGRDVVQLDEYLFFYRIQAISRTTGFQQDRSAVVKTYADIFRANADFYLRNAEFIFEHRFGLYDELVRYRARYGPMERFLQTHPRLFLLARRLGRVFNRLLGMRG